MEYNIDENIFYIFTDGASRSVFNTKLKIKTGRHGGMGIWFVYLAENGEKIEKDKSDYISYTKATNQDMELWAAVDGLKLILEEDLTGFNEIRIVTDSLFLSENAKNAIYGYRDKPGVSWKRKNGDPIIHKKKWRELAKYSKQIFDLYKKKIVFERVKGHRDNKYHNKADGSAVKGAQAKVKVLGNNTELRSPFFKNAIRFKQGYIPIQGQEVLIHICNSRYIRKRWFRYNYEIVSRDSEFFMQRGWIFYEKSTLSAELIYCVEIKNDGSNQIEEIVSEHTKTDIKQRMIQDGIETDILYGKLGKK